MDIILNKKHHKYCPVCKKEFFACNNAQVYCTLYCRSKRQNTIKQNPKWRDEPRSCRNCGKDFFIPEKSSPNRAYCSEECQISGYSKHTRGFKEANPGAMTYYNQRRRAKYGNRDTLTQRLYKKYKDLPRSCEAKDCNESRVIDLAHKPEYKRNGAHRVMKHYQRHMFWILCPTHHAIIDRGVCTPDQIGLK